MLLTANISIANNSRMRFSDWFEQQAGLTQEAFARTVGVTQGRIAQLINGELPSMKLALAIERATSGAVTPNDFSAGAGPTRESERVAS